MKSIMHRTSNRKNGFTLVELLLAMALMGMFTAITTAIFASVVEVQDESLGSSAVTQDGRYIVAKLSYDISQASVISTPSSLGATGSTLALTVNGTTQTYSLNGTNLQLVAGANTDALNGSETTVSNLSFQRLGNSGGNDTVRFSFTLTSKAVTSTGPRQLSFTSTAGRR